MTPRSSWCGDVGCLPVGVRLAGSVVLGEDVVPGAEEDLAHVGSVDQGVRGPELERVLALVGIGLGVARLVGSDHARVAGDEHELIKEDLLAILPLELRLNDDDQGRDVRDAVRREEEDSTGALARAPTDELELLVGVRSEGGDQRRRSDRPAHLDLEGLLVRHVGQVESPDASLEEDDQVLVSCPVLLGVGVGKDG